MVVWLLDTKDMEVSPLEYDFLELRNGLISMARKIGMTMDADEECRAKDPAKCRVHGIHHEENKRDFAKDPIDGFSEDIWKTNHLFAKPNPTGKNTFKAGWNSENAEIHWEKHQKEYPGMHTVSQYIKKAISLLEKPVGNGIQGHLRDDWCIVRYDGKNYAIGNPFTGVIDMFPAKQWYFDRQKDLREAD